MYKVFEKRSKIVPKLIKLGDNLGRSLRENVSIFLIDTEDRKVAYVTESGKILSGTYSKDITSLKNLLVEDIELFMDNKKFDSFVNKKLSSFIANINEDKFSEAKSTFSDVLNLWEDRVKLKNIQSRLVEKAAASADIEKIAGTPQWDRFLEVAPELVEYLKKNKDTIKNIDEIQNAVRLVTTVAEAFDLPKLDYDQLEKMKVYKVANEFNSTIYEMICRQELVKKELIEHKENFNNIWNTRDSVKTLAGLLQSDNGAEIGAALAEAITDIPYLALASKKQLTEVFDSILSATNQEFPIVEVQKYSSLIFELKKPVRKALVGLLNQKYGINILNLKEDFSFKNLANTEVVIFESMAKLSPKGSVLRQVLSETSELLKNKSGVETLDVASVLEEVFQAAGYFEFLNEMAMAKYLDFNRIASDLGEVGNILRMIQGSAASQGGMGQQPGQSAINPYGDPQGGMPQQQPAQIGMPKPGMGAPAPSPLNSPQLGSEDDGAAMPPNDPIGPEGQEQGMMVGGAGGGMDDEMGDPDTEGPDMQGGDLMSHLAELEKVLADLKLELGVDGEEGGDDIEGDFPGAGEESLDGEEGMDGMEDMEGMGDEEGGEFPGEEEEEGGDINIDTGDGDDDVHVDKVKGKHDIDNDEEEGEAMPSHSKKGGKGKPPPFAKGGGKDKKAPPKGKK